MAVGEGITGKYRDEEGKCMTKEAEGVSRESQPGEGAICPLSG